MYEKGNKYLADWYDRKGKRRRKSSSTSEVTGLKKASSIYFLFAFEARGAHPWLYRRFSRIRRPLSHLLLI